MIANYTTAVNVSDTLTEIESLLSTFGANEISKQYEGGRPFEIVFVVKLDGYPLQFQLPINVSAVGKVLNQYKLKAAWKKPEHAERVAWRIMRDWIRVQLSMVEMKQADLAQVFMPYAISGGQAAYQAFRVNRSKELGSGS